MTMRRHLPHVVALLLGVGAALLVACGGTTKGGIPAASAGELKSQIEDVQQAVDGGRCNELDGQLRQVDEGIEALPATVDQRLRQSLADAGDRLRQAANSECADTTTETQTTETRRPRPCRRRRRRPRRSDDRDGATGDDDRPAAATPAPVETTPVPPPPVEPPPAEPARAGAARDARRRRTPGGGAEAGDEG